MKQLIVTMSDAQHETLTACLQKGTIMNVDNAMLSGFSITLNTVEFGFSWLTVDMYGEIDLGEVEYKIV